MGVLKKLRGLMGIGLTWGLLWATVTAANRTGGLDRRPG